jgi:hypothetical protein
MKFFISALITGMESVMTDRMVYQRHVGGFLIYPVCCVWFNLQNLPSIPAYFDDFS